MIKNAVVIKENEVDANVVSIGAYVKVYDETFDEELEYNLVGSNEANALFGNISDQSPIGAALIGKRVGDEVDIHTPSGDILKLKLLEVSRKKNAQ